MFPSRPAARSMRAALATLGLLALVGCTTPYKPGTPYFIEDVQVTAAPGTLSPGTADAIERDIEAVVARAPRTGEPKRLDVEVRSFRTKSAGMSLLVGDSNSMAGTATITGAGATEWSEDVTAVSDVAVQGIAGALIAAVRTRERVEKQLAERLALTVARLAYGGKLPAAGRRAAPARRSAPAAPPVPTPAPTAPGTAEGVVAGV